MADSENTELLTQPVALHLQISGLVAKILDRFSVVSIGDLCALDLDVVASEKGVGEKKVETLRRLIAAAQELAS